MILFPLLEATVDGEGYTSMGLVNHTIEFWIKLYTILSVGKRRTLHVLNLMSNEAISPAWLIFVLYLGKTPYTFSDSREIFLCLAHSCSPGWLLMCLADDHSFG